MTMIKFKQFIQAFKGKRDASMPKSKKGKPLAKVKIDVKPGKARLQKQIDRLSFDPRAELQKKIDKFKLDEARLRGKRLLVAIKMHDGTIHHSDDPSHHHHDLYTKHSTNGHDVKDVGWYDTHDKKFLTRDQAQNIHHEKGNRISAYLEKRRKRELQEHLLVAIHHNGKIHVGHPGEIHADIADRKRLHGFSTTDGFVPHDDHKNFMNRTQALQHVKHNDPKTFNKIPEHEHIPGLESDSYHRVKKK